MRHHPPWVALRRESRSDAEICEAVVGLASEVRPDAVVWSHTGVFAIPAHVFAELRGLACGPTLAYMEGDMYHWFYKPLPRPALMAMSACDVVFVCGGGSLVRMLERHGCRDIRYLPLTTDSVRFGNDRPATSPHFDVVLVGNLPMSRVPFRTMPGCRWRVAAVRLLERRLGSRFAVFGTGWSGPSAQGPTPYPEQGAAYQSARIAVGINNLHAPFYFSDRLPIALSSGVFMVHNRERGLGRVLPSEIRDAMFGHGDDELWAAVKHALDADNDDLRNAELRARAFVLENLTTYQTLRYVKDVLTEIAHRRGWPAPVRAGFEPVVGRRSAVRRTGQLHNLKAARSVSLSSPRSARG